MEVKPLSVSEPHRQRLLDDCYTEDEIAVVELYRGMLEAKYDDFTGQCICDKVNVLKSMHLTFKQWAQENVYAHNQNDVPHVIVGGWYGIRYVPRGMVKPKRKGQRFLWLSNGQASTGAQQVCYFADTLEISFPEFEEIEKQHFLVINDSAARRASRVSTYLLKYKGSGITPLPPKELTPKVELTGKQSLQVNRELANTYPQWLYERKGTK